MAEPAPLRLSWASVSELGARASNQDALGQAQHGAVHCFVVSDGAGGHEGGEVASRIVVDSIVEQFNRAPGFGSAPLLACVGHAIANVALGQRAAPHRHDMSATVAALLVEQDAARAVWAHLGDTRLYLFRGERLHAVSKDHSLTQQLIDAGYAKAAQLRVHPQRNLLYAAVGAVGETPIASSEGEVALAAGDAFLLCTDGLWEWAMEADMEATLAHAIDGADWLAQLCALAAVNSAASGKARDNFSAYAIMLAAA
ncbi:MAG: PP2C family serine/threonine-protein phosphatase [Pseudomonadota bacterium]